MPSRFADKQFIMTTTLLVQYTPRLDSNTKKLVDFFIQQCEGKTNIQTLNLALETPQLWLEENLNIMVKRNFAGVPLDSEESEVLAVNDKMVEQVQEADYIVLAHPMFNLSLPATVKAWFDAILQVGRTFQLGPNGYEGLCPNIEAMVIMTAGTDHELYPDDNFASGLSKACFGMMGINSVEVAAFGMNVYTDKVEEILNKSKKALTQVCNQWYR